jgi:methylenetetrahydrofolate reductase (NADPH)
MAKIADLLAAGRTTSYEFFPPKSEAAAKALDDALEDLTKLGPDFVSVTYGALGTTRAPTRDLVIRIDHERPYPAMPHLTCVGQTRDDLLVLLDEYRQAGIDNVLALAGDPPADGSEPGGDFTYATELIELARSVGDFSIGVAAFPELHPRSRDRETDRRLLAEKLAQADFAITQFFFEAEHFRSMMDELDALGCDTPIIPGVMPFVSIAGTRRMAAVNGCHIPDELQARMDAVDGDAEAVRRLGVEVATALCHELLDQGVRGLHLYAMNRSTSIREVYAGLGWDQP